jgi:type IV pilus assembly protein PilF
MKHLKIQAAVLLAACLPLVLCASAQKRMERARDKDPKYQYNLGSFYLNNNDIDQAIGAFRRSIELDGRFHLPYNGLGLAYTMKGNLTEAAKAFEKCLALNPQFTEARNNLGMTYQELGYLDKAEAEYKRAISDLAYPSREMPYCNLARLYLNKGLNEAALETVQKALLVNANMALAYNLKGMILEKMNRLPEAITAYEIATRKVPDEVGFGYNLAVAAFKNNERDKARAEFERILPKVTDPELRDRINQYLALLK